MDAVHPHEGAVVRVRGAGDVVTGTQVVARDQPGRDAHVVGVWAVPVHAKRTAAGTGERDDAVDAGFGRVIGGALGRLGNSHWRLHVCRGWNGSEAGIAGVRLSRLHRWASENRLSSEGAATDDGGRHPAGSGPRVARVTG